MFFLAGFTENSKPYPLTNAWEKFRWIFIGHLRQFIYLFIFTLLTVDLKLLIYTKKPLYSLYSNNIELIDVNFVTEQDMQSFPKEFLKSCQQTGRHIHIRIYQRNTQRKIPFLCCEFSVADIFYKADMDIAKAPIF